MTVEFHLEEPSAEEALQLVVPKIIGSQHTLRFFTYPGKPSLLRRLPARLRAYPHYADMSNTGIVVLVDEDRQDCSALKRRLEEASSDAGLVTKSSANSGQRFVVLNRIAVEELEAWFFGDVSAIRSAYPRVSASIGRRSVYRDPDSIGGGTSEALERVLQRAGYYRQGVIKREVARKIASHMYINTNKSHSFAVFRAGLRALVSQY